MIRILFAAWYGILNELIKKIAVCEKQMDGYSIKTQEVNIYYDFIGCINDLLRKWFMVQTGNLRGTKTSINKTGVIRKMYKVN